MKYKVLILFLLLITFLSIESIYAYLPRDFYTRQFRADIYSQTQKKPSKGRFDYEGKVYFVDDNGNFKNGWIEEDNFWYYYEPYMIVNELKDISGKTYYFNEKGQMVTNEILKLGETEIFIDKNGYCTIERPEGFFIQDELVQMAKENSDMFNGAKILTNVDGVTHITICQNGQLYIGYPSLLLSNGYYYDNFSKDMSNYILHTMTNMCDEIYAKLKGNDSCTITPISINNYNLTNVSDGVIYFTGISNVAKIFSDYGKNNEAFNINFNFAYIIDGGAINSNYDIS